MGKDGENRLLFARGFTLIEVLLVVLISGILLGLAAPEYRAWLKDLRLTKATDTLYSSLIRARTEALRTQRPISLCRTGDIFGSDPNCEANIYGTSQANVTKDWSYGWLIYSTSGTSVAYDPFLGHELFAAVETGVSNRRVTVRSNSSAQTFITYGRDGRLIGGAPIFSVCDDRNGEGYGYEIKNSVSGRPKVKNYDPVDGSLNCNP